MDKLHECRLPVLDVARRAAQTGGDETGGDGIHTTWGDLRRRARDGPATRVDGVFAGWLGDTAATP